MEDKSKRSWYEKKRYLIPLGIVALLGITIGGDNKQEIKETRVVAPVVQQVQQKTPEKKTTPVQPTKKEVGGSTLSNNNYYVNSKGDTVHSPAYSRSVPQGASARCRDGTYSFSQSRRGTCSHHGGVASWL